MGLKKSSDAFEWFERRFEWLVQPQIIDDLVRVAPSICFRAHPWTFVKLVILAEYVANVYTMIIPKYYPGRFVYIDLFAGSGLNVVEYRGNRVCIPGSSIIAYAFAREEFEKLILVDKESVNLAVAKQRLKTLGADENRIVTVPGDVNDLDVITKVLKHIPSSDRHALIFVDPSGAPPRYEVMKKLLEYIPSDLVILIQRRYMWMWKNNPQQQHILTEVFGSEDWKECRSEDMLIAKYLERLSLIGSKKVRRELYDYIPIRLYSEDIYYDLAFLVRETSGGSPWFKEVIPYLKEKVKEMNKAIDQAFAIFTGSTKTLLEFIPPEKLLGRKTLDPWLKKRR